MIVDGDVRTEHAKEDVQVVVAERVRKHVLEHVESHVNGVVNGERNKH